MKYLLLKEIQNSLYNYRFIVCIIICMFFTPLSFYVSLTEYKNEHQEYQKEYNDYISTDENTINPDFIAKAYKKPSEYSFLSKGFEKIIPYLAKVSKDKLEYVYKKNTTNYYKTVFGQLDYQLVIIYIITLIIIVLSFDSISSEHENGVFQLVLSNSIPRHKILLSKILSISIIVTISITAGLVLGLFVIIKAGVSNTLSSEFLHRFTLTFLFTIIYTIGLINFCTFISIISKSSKTSIITLVLFFCLFTLLIPKASPIIAQLVSSVESKAQLENKIALIEEDYMKQMENEESAAIEKILVSNNLSLYDIFKITQPKYAEIKEQLDKSLSSIRNDYQVKLNKDITTLTNHFEHKSRVQKDIEINISRLSPTCCYSLIISEIANTGQVEHNNFINQSKEFKQLVNKNIFNKWEFTNYSLKGITFNGYEVKDNFNDEFALPIMDYKPTKLSNAMNNCWDNLIVLLTFLILSFTSSYFFFKKLNIKKI